MKKLLAFILIISFPILSLIAQTGTIKGIVSDKETDQLLIGANLIVNHTSYNGTTNKLGEFLIEGIPTGKYNLTISFVGYQTLINEINVEQNETLVLNVKLSSTPIHLGEVMVTSTRRENIVREISLPIEVITKTKLEEIPSTTISDALTNEPGVNLSRDGIWATHVNIRGLSKQNVVTLIDGNRIETATNIAAGMSLIDIDDVERIEVIKSGVSSLYGTGATGGVVNIQSLKPAYSDALNISGSLNSSYNSVNEGSKGNISLSASQSNWFAKFSGTLRNASNTETPEGTLENSQFKDNNISAAIGFRPFVNHELKINYQRFSAKNVGIPGGDPFPATAEANYPTELREMYSVEYQLQNLFPSLMTLSAKYFHQLIERRVEIIPNQNATTNTSADHIIDGFQFQTDWYLSNNNRLIAGIDYWQREYDGSRTRHIIPQKRFIIDSPVPNSIYKSLGVFAQDEFILFNDQLNLTLGGRYDFINVSNEETNNPNFIIVDGNRNDRPPIIPEASYPKNEDSDKSWSANIGLLFKATENIDFTLNLARAFRSPTLEERYQYIDLGGTVYLGNPNLDSEKSYSIDLGIRYWSDFASIKGNVFYNTFTDLVADQYDVNDSLYRTQNIGEAELYGFELSAEVNPYKKIVMYGNTSYVRGIDSGNKTDLAEIPPLNGVIGIKTPVNDLFSVDVNFQYSAEQNKVALGEKSTSGYGVLNLFVNSFPINLGLVDLQIFAGIENVFDKAYKNHLSTFRGLVALEPGRNIFTKIKVSW
ncbi:MAG: TonB-dependent receptor [Melioribacteraceae bacterium]|nr:MAG: TonB-dependent receptor [Melioribacteraceae bacterium]